MSACPYTWVKSFFSLKRNKSTEASNLRVTVSRNQEITVDVSLPARSARWLIELIPSDVVCKIRAEGIPLDDIQSDLAASKELVPQKIFTLTEPNREVTVWLE